MSQVKSNVLIAIDGSVQSMNAAAYIRDFMPPDRTRIVLFHVDSEIMDLYFDIDDKPDTGGIEKTTFDDWNAMRLKHIHERLDSIRDQFIKKGFQGKDVEIITRELTIGVTRDIIEESKRGYDLLVVGKTGTRCVTGILTGSVTAKLISKVFHIPMVVVEGRPETDNIMIGFDGSQGSIDAVIGLLPFIDDAKNIMICHVIRSINLIAGDFDLFSSSLGKTYNPEFDLIRIQNQKFAIEKSMKKEVEWLKNHGISADNIKTSLMEGYMSRSQALVEKSKKEGYGSIVLGRRGHSVVVEFFIGRVGRKVIQMSDSMAVWIMKER